ncbi:hypothetical protein [Dyella sp.]|uniref:hypothetical protein n=1 Tax=Dyella sp. TaxID=1869338 RepID=UPI002D79413D|nr:hypothetical protein [Dyella sp.]HET7329899.1 hypothetical protein [Dyella sp.]
MNARTAPPHAEFVKGLADKRYGVATNSRSHHLLSKGLNITFAVLVHLYMLGPLLIVPTLAYVFGNWWLLFGVVACYVGVFSATGAMFRFIIVFATMFCIGFWLHGGFHLKQYVTFFYLCALGGYFAYAFADNFLAVSAERAVVQYPELYEKAVTQHLLDVVSTGKRQVLNDSQL